MLSTPAEKLQNFFGVFLQFQIGVDSPTVIGAAISSKVGVKPKLPTHYFINAENGLELPSIILMEQLRTIDKQRLAKYIGRLSQKHISGMNHALAVSIDLVEAIPQKLMLCLCNACADAFRGTGAFLLNQVEQEQAGKEVCSYCKQGAGAHYDVRPKVGRVSK